MPRTCIDVGPREDANRTARDHVALISAGDLSKRIGQVLEQEELVFDIFDDVETLLTGEAVERNPTSIVLWIEDTVVGLACCIEPLTSTFARVPLVVVCASIERWGVRAALSAGAAGVVLSDDLDSALGPCLQAVRSGQICVPRAYGRQIEPPILSSREKQILGLVVMSYTNGQIARQLFLAESTVKSHLSSAFRKLGVRSRYEAVSIIVGSERGLGMGVISLVGGDESASGRVPSPEAVCMNSMQHR